MGGWTDYGSKPGQSREIIAPTFRTRWAAHDVRFHDTGTKDYHHPIVGDVSLTFDRMELAADPGLAITIWTAEPGTKSAEALSLLGSWAATPPQPEHQDAPDRR